MISGIMANAMCDVKNASELVDIVTNAFSLLFEFSSTRMEGAMGLSLGKLIEIL